MNEREVPPMDSVARTKALAAQRAKRWRAAHREYRQTYSRAYNQRPQVRERRATAWQQYYQRNRQQLLAYQHSYRLEKQALLASIDTSAPLAQILDSSLT
jgi:hypothetical protein